MNSLFNNSSFRSNRCDVLVTLSGNNPRNLDKILTNSVDPDQTAPKEQSDQGLHCLPSHQQNFHCKWVVNRIVCILQ